MPVHGEGIAELRSEIEDLRASRARLVAAADGERRELEHHLHDGVQQLLVALVVNLQRAQGLCVSDAAAAGAVLEDVGKDARDALEELRRLALELYLPLLDAGGLVVALRSAAADAGIVARVQAEELPPCRPESGRRSISAASRRSGTRRCTRAPVRKRRSRSASTVMRSSSRSPMTGAGLRRAARRTAACVESATASPRSEGG
jgi:Histidine kinase